MSSGGVAQQSHSGGRDSPADLSLYSSLPERRGQSGGSFWVGKREHLRYEVSLLTTGNRATFLSYVCGINNRINGEPRLIAQCCICRKSPRGPSLSYLTTLCPWHVVGLNQPEFHFLRSRVQLFVKSWC